MSGRRPVGAVDSIWLAMDRPENLMVIDSIMLFEEPLDWDRLEAVVQERLVDHFPVFAQRAVESHNPLGMPHWEDDPDFALSRHLRRVVLPAPGADAELEAFVEERMRTPLDHRHPLWELSLVEGYAGGGSAVVARFHHALADGIALAQVLLSLTDDQPTGDLSDRAAADDHVAVEATGRPTGVLGAASRVTGAATSSARGALHLLSHLPQALDPSYAVETMALALKTGRIADKLLLGHNPESPLSGEPGVVKRAVWSTPRSLADIKRVGRTAGATVNDVLVGAVSGAISTYLVDRGAEAVDLTTMVPINLRPAGEPLPRELGNKFALVMLPLPTGNFSPRKRLAETKRRMDSIKHSPEAILTFGLINAIGRTNPEVARSVVDFFAAKAIGVTTNVAGPLAGRYLAGARITGVLGWVPGSGRQTLGVCIFSYDNIVRVGFKVDAGVVPDPQRLVHAFDDELDELLRLSDVR